MRYLHPLVVDRILLSRKWKRYPPSMEWIGRQPAGLVREVILCAEADDGYMAATVKRQMRDGR